MKTLAAFLFLLSAPVWAGKYSVPVSPALEPFATFTIADPAVELNGNQIAISYQMPPELVGAGADPVVLRGALPAVAGAEFRLETEEVIALCKTVEHGTSCAIRFQKDMPIDQAASYLFQQEITLQELTARLRVLESFGGEPVGTLTY